MMSSVAEIQEHQFWAKKRRNHTNTTQPRPHAPAMARKARGPDATSAKVDPSYGRDAKRNKNKKMGLAEEVRGMLGKSAPDEKPLEADKGRQVSVQGLVNLSTFGEDVSDEDVPKNKVPTKNLKATTPTNGKSNEQRTKTIASDDDDDNEGEDEDEDSDFEGFEEEEDFSESTEGSEAAEIDVDDLKDMADVDALEQTNLDELDMPVGDALQALQAELKAINSSSDSEVGDQDADVDGDSDEEEEEEEEIALSDLESDQDAADIVPVARETINNVTALNAAYNRIALDLPPQFSLHQTLTTSSPIDIPDINDDLARELEFYKQGLQHCQEAKMLIDKEGAAWARPSDYFAEMVKTDDHMERIRKELVTEATSAKASADAKRQRELKKFGKQVQINKTLERAQQKKDTTDKLKALKRKRGASDLDGKEDFDVALEEAVSDTKRVRSDRGGASTRGSRGAGREGSRGSSRGGGASGAGRDAKDKKFGFGGKKRFAKSNTAESTTDFGGLRYADASSSSRGRGGGRGGRGGGGGRGRGAGRGSSRGGRGGASSSRGGRGRPGKSKRH